MAYKRTFRRFFLLATITLAACSGGPGLFRTPATNPIESQLLAEIALERGEYAVAVSASLNVALQSRDPEHAQRATELAYDYGYDAYALKAAERWVKLSPDSVAAHGYLGRLYARYNQLDDAWDSLEFALGAAEERHDQDYAMLFADLAIEPRSALALAKRFAAAYPETPGILRSLAELEAQLGNLDEAVVAARHTISLRPDWNTTRVWMAHLLLENGEQSSAFEQMAFALEMSPGLEFELEFVGLLAAADQLPAAAERLERISDRFPAEQSVALMGAALLTQAGQLNDAAGIYQTLLETGQCISECYWNLGAIAYQLGDYERARQLFSRVGPGERLQAAKLALTQTWLAVDQPDQALAVLDAFAADYPKRSFVLLQPRVNILVSAGRYATAQELVAQALEYRPWSVDLWLTQGGVLEQSGQLDAALAAFRQAWELAPDNATTQNAYGYTLVVATKRYAEAQELIAQALTQEPTNPAIMDSMGWVLYKQGNTRGARLWLEQAYQLQPDPEIAAHLGELLWSVGELDAARSVLDTALTRYPDNKALLAALAHMGE